MLNLKECKQYRQMQNMRQMHLKSYRDRTDQIGRNTSKGRPRSKGRTEVVWEKAKEAG